MKKLGGYFCFKKTRIDGKTKGKMFGGFREIAYLCGEYDESVYYILITNNFHEKTAIR